MLSTDSAKLDCTLIPFINFYFLCNKNMDVQTLPVTYTSGMFLTWPFTVVVSCV